MAVSKSNERIEYMCTYCGRKVQRRKSMGRPDPGRCPRRSGDKPHSWVKNRVLP